MRARATFQSGFSLVELLVALVVTLVILGVGVATFSSALSTRSREASTSDALTSAQAALNVMTREVGNAGYGLTTNGIVLGDCAANPCSQYLRVRSNYINNDTTTNAWGEDVAYYYDAASESVVRYDVNTGFVSGVINRVSQVDFRYYDYTSDSAGVVVISGPNTTPTTNTGKVNIHLTVQLPDVVGQPSGRTASFNSDITLRNAPFMRKTY